MPLRFLRALAVSTCLVSSYACGGGDLSLPEDGNPAEISAVQGDDQSGPVGAQLPQPLVVLVTDAQGRGVQGIPIAFMLGAGAGGGTTTPDTTETDVDGHAEARWVLGGDEGRQEVDAEVVGAALSVRFTAEAANRSGLRLERADGNDQSAAPGDELAEPLVVRLVDESGAGVRGRAVAWVVARGDGSAAPQSSDTDDAGFASTRWTLGPAAGANVLNAVISGVGVVTFTATGVGDGGSGPSATRSTLTVSPTTIQVVSGLSTITVMVLDAGGSPVAGSTVSLAATGVGNLLVQPAAPTGPDGVATGTLQSAVPGTKVVSATVNGALTIAQTAQVSVTATPAEPSGLEFRVEPSDVGEGEEFSPAVEVAVVDAEGNVVERSGIEIEVELLRSSGQRSRRLEGDDTQFTEDGIAVFSDLAVDRGDEEYRLRASAPDLPELGSVESETFNVED